MMSSSRWKWLVVGVATIKDNPEMFSESEVVITFIASGGISRLGEYYCTESCSRVFRT